MYEKFKKNLNKGASSAVSDMCAAAHAGLSDLDAAVQHRFTPGQKILMDLRGFTYGEVRFCDLDLIRDK